MTRPDSINFPLRLTRNKWVSAKSEARAGTRHSGTSAAKAALIIPAYVAAKAATHNHPRPSPNILLIGTDVGVARLSRYATFHSTTEAGSTRMLASWFDSGVTGEQVPTFAERGFLLDAKRSRPRCRSGAMRRSQNGGDFFSRHSGISEGRKCWRTRPASESARA